MVLPYRRFRTELELENIHARILDPKTSVGISRLASRAKQPGRCAGEQAVGGPGDAQSCDRGGWRIRGSSLRGEGQFGWCRAWLPQTGETNAASFLIWKRLFFQILLVFVFNNGLAAPFVPFRPLSSVMKSNSEKFFHFF